MNGIIKIGSIIVVAFLVSSCAQTAMNTPNYTPAQTSERMLIISGEEFTEHDVGGFISWKCRDIFEDDGPTLVELGTFSSPSAPESAGFVLYDGTNVGEVAFYQRKGLNHDWVWGPDSQNLNYNFVIKPDGTGLYYDFSGVDAGERIKANEVYKCRR